jgi:transcriptional regulator GlxA family with amidase domain
VVQTDLIIIPAIHGEKQKVIDDNKAYLPWIVRAIQRRCFYATLCIGVFLLAATGLLKGRRCATHWAEADNFRRMFPDVHLVPDKIITDDNGIYTSGGAYSGSILFFISLKNLLAAIWPLPVPRFLRSRLNAITSRLL